MAAHAPSFRYHPTEAPSGKLFQTHAELDALDPAWVDTPAKFTTPLVTEEIVDPVADALAPLRTRGRRKKADDRD